MTDLIKWLQLFFATIGGLMGAFLGGVDGIVYALILFVVIDYSTGFVAAVRSKNLSSEIGFWGLVKKAMLFALVGVANTVDVHVIGGGAAIRTAVIFFFLSNEGLSILENAARLGAPIPTGLKDILAQLKDNGKKK